MVHVLGLQGSGFGVYRGSQTQGPESLNPKPAKVPLRVPLAFPFPGSIGVPLNGIL